MGALKRDYYEILGVSREADADSIRRAFHALVREWHPDVAEGPDAEARFRELAEAYSVLSTEESRRLYDRYGYRGRGNRAADDSRGADIHLDLELRSFEAARGSRPIVSFKARGLCSVCLGAADEREACERCGGTGIVELERRLRVLVPPGVEDGSYLRVAEEGNLATPESVPGDLLIEVHVLPAPKDPRSVRYFALVLLLVAVAALAVYLMR